VSWAPLALSLQIATIAMIVSVIVGTGLAVVLAWKRLPLPDLFHALVSTPLVLPPTVLGYYLLVALGPNSVVGRVWHAVFGSDIAFTFTAAVIAATVGSLPLVVGAVRVGLDAIDPVLVAAARTLGASPLRVLATVTLPLAAPGIAAGAMLGFARALGDYGMTQMIASSRFNGLFGIENTSPASIYVYDEMVAMRDVAARNMAIATTLLGITMLFLANRLTRRLGRGSSE
jgi:molybdate transport system permease protein